VDLRRVLFDHSFHLRFATFEYILIHQTDTWVFRDAVAKWCRGGPELIGTPWFEGRSILGPQSQIIIGTGRLRLCPVSKRLCWYVVADWTASLRFAGGDHRGSLRVLLRYARITASLRSRTGEFDIADQCFSGRDPIFEDLFCVVDLGGFQRCRFGSWHPAFGFDSLVFIGTSGSRLLGLLFGFLSR
jgi:hypothetical protein